MPPILSKFPESPDIQEPESHIFTGEGDLDGPVDVVNFLLSVREDVDCGER